MEPFPQKRGVFPGDEIWRKLRPLNTPLENRSSTAVNYTAVQKAERRNLEKSFLRNIRKNRHRQSLRLEWNRFAWNAIASLGTSSTYTPLYFQQSFSFFFKRMSRKGSESEGESGCGSGRGGSAWRWKLKSSAGFRWKKRFNLHLWFIDDVLFKIVSAFEAVFLVSTLCFFFLCCGCNF